MEPGGRPKLLTPAGVRQLLDVHGLAPRRAAGQNFVVDPNTVRKIVRDAQIRRGDAVLEIGAGLGSLTLALAAHARRVVAVEVDAGLAAALRGVVTDLPNVEVVHADALRVDLDALVGEPGRLVANLPYHIATPLVFAALSTRYLTDLFVMVQREVGERWAATPGHPLYGAVSVKLRLLARVELVATVPRTVFHPVPRVDSVTVRIVRRDDAPPTGALEAVVSVVNRAFGQRRKTLRNALARLADSGRLEAAFTAAGVDGGARAEQLDVEDYCRLARALEDRLEGQG